VRMAPRPRERMHPMAQVLYLPALAFFVAFKPNTWLVAAALAASFAFVRGAHDCVRGALLAAAALAIAYASSAWHFDSASVWSAWHAFLLDPSGGLLLYAVHYGNASLAKIMSEQWHGRDPYLIGLALGALLALIFAAALTAWGKDRANAAPRLREALADPWIMASAGILLTFASAPLLWPHYEVLLLLPMAGIVGRTARPDGASIALALAYVLLSRPLGAAFAALGVPAATVTAFAVGWLPVAAAFCMRLAAPEPRLTYAR